MAEFKTRDKGVSRLSIGSLELDVKDGRVDLSGLKADERRRAEFELSRLSLVERAEEGASNELAASAGRGRGE